RERRVTNHAVVAMLGSDVKQTRCTTCDAEHEYKHAKVPRQRRKNETPAALYSQVLANAPKRVAHGESAAAANGTNGANGSNGSIVDASHPDESAGVIDAPIGHASEVIADALEATPTPAPTPLDDAAAIIEDDDPEDNRSNEEGPVHRPLIRASLPRHE